MSYIICRSFFNKNAAVTVDSLVKGKVRKELNEINCRFSCSNRIHILNKKKSKTVLQME